MKLIKILTKHLDEVNESYFKHLLVVLLMINFLILSIFALLIHGIFPFLFKEAGTTFLEIARDIHNKRGL